MAAPMAAPTGPAMEPRMAPVAPPAMVPTLEGSVTLRRARRATFLAWEATEGPEPRGPVRAVLARRGVAERRGVVVRRAPARLVRVLRLVRERARVARFRLVMLPRALIPRA